MTRKHKVLDLFCGCGGLSEGFRLAGFDIVMGIDFNRAAIDTYNQNFGENKGVCIDLLEYQSEQIVASSAMKEKVDVIIGGPPCQGFSSANRWNDTNNDPRNKLFMEYFKFVKLLNPDVVVIENVAQITSKNNGEVKDAIYELYEELGYTVSHAVLKAEDYGVPQKRRRNFFVMLKNEAFDFDSLVKLPKVTVKEAIGDLYDYKQNDDGVYLGKPATNAFLKYARNSEYIKNNYIAFPSLATQEKMKHVPQGGNWRDIPPEMFKTVRNNRHSSAYRRLKEDDQSVTIDTGNAHSNYYHPLYNRIPTVREAARLQSFSDAFVFCGSKSDQYRQVGNAVPPLLAKALADAIKKTLDKDTDKKQIIDLFCGCGGLSLGFEMAGYKPAVSIDLWDDAIETYNHNRNEKAAICKDITTLGNDYFYQFRGKCCGVIGGPPCQGFSTVGKRETDDPRNLLYREYCRVVECVDPDFFVLENVKGLLTLNKGKFRDAIIDDFTRLGYSVEYRVLNAANYGVPQNRERVFFVGTKRNYHFKFPLEQENKISSSEAISDLLVDYSNGAQNDYQRCMRGNNKVLTNHELTNHTQETIAVISMIPDGGNIKSLPEEYWNIRKYNKAFERMNSQKPSNTVDTGHRNYFHYKENRIPTVRENARLQSFPDNYVILGSRTSQYKQVGNAVPVLLAQAVAKGLYEDGDENV